MSRAAYGWYVVVVLSFAHFVSFLARSVVIVALEPLKSTFGLADVTLGALYGTGFVVLYAIAGLPLGFAADRVNRKLLIAVGIGVWTIATIAFGLARTTTELFAARVAVGLGEAALVPAALSLIGEYVEPQRVGRAVAVFVMGPSFGISAAYLLGGVVLPLRGSDWPLSGLGLNESWRLLFLISAIPGLLALLLIVFTLREPQRARRSSVLRNHDNGHFVRHWRAYLAHIFSAIVVIFGVQAISAWTPSFFVRTFSKPLNEVSSVVGLISLFTSPISAFLGGWLMDHLHSKEVRAPAAVVVAAALTVALPFYLIFGFASSLMACALALLTTEVLLGLAVPALLTGIQLLTPARSRGIATAMLMTAITLLGVGLGPPFCGYIADHVFGGARALGHAMTAVAVGAAILGASISLLGRRPAVRAINAASRQDSSETAGAIIEA